MKREEMFKKVLLLSLLFVCIAIIPVNSFAISIKAGDHAADFKLEDLTSGKKITLSEFKGKIVLLTFWATWCPRCWEEIDYIKARFDKDENIVVLLVNMETQSTSPAHVKRIKSNADEHDIKMPMLLDKRLEVWDSYGVNSLPTTVIVDKDGKVAFAEANFYFASRDNIEEVIKKLQGE